MRQTTRGKFGSKGRGGQSGGKSKAINQQEGAISSTPHKPFDNDNKGGRNTSRNGRGRSGGRGATQHCYECNKMGHKSFECPDNEETRHRGTHIAQGEEGDITHQIVDEVPETGEALIMRKVLLKPVKEIDEPPQ